MSGEIVKEDIEGCYVDEQSFRDMYERLCKLEAVEHVVCDGNFKGRSGRTGWVHGWSPVTTDGDVANVTTGWLDIGNSWVGPDCVHDADAVVDVGNHYMLLRRIRAYHWIDVRLLRNGVACNTKTSDTYTYRDKREDVNLDVMPIHAEIWKSGNSLLCCTNSPALSEYQVQVQYRYRGVSSQPSSYFRYIGGLRSEAVFNAFPKQVITEVI